MPTAVFDASLITFRKRAEALYGFNSKLEAARLGNGGIVAREQLNTQMAEVIITRKQGGCFCAQDAAGLSIQANAPGACSCAR